MTEEAVRKQDHRPALVTHFLSDGTCRIGIIPSVHWVDATAWIGLSGTLSHESLHVGLDATAGRNAAQALDNLPFAELLYQHNIGIFGWALKGMKWKEGFWSN